MVCLFSPSASAQTISFTVQNPPSQIPVGGTFVFQGTVTNNSGSPLDVTDFFFNFSGYDPNVMTVQQLLGNQDFPLNNQTTSATVDLFSVSLDSATPVGQTFPIDVTLQDSIGDQTPNITFTVLSAKASPVPESSTLLQFGLLLTMGTILAVASRLTRKVRST